MNRETDGVSKLLSGEGLKVSLPAGALIILGAVLTR